MHVHGINPEHHKPTPARSIVPSRVLPVPRFRYSPVVAAGPFVFVSGMVGLDAASCQLAAGGAGAEAAQILANLKRLLDEQGWSLEQLVVARVYCSDFATFPEINAAWEECFADVVPPARTSVGVSALPLGARVEMEFQLWVGAAA